MSSKDTVEDYRPDVAVVSAELTNNHPLHIRQQANQHPKGKAFFVRHNELVSMCNWSQSQRRSVESSGAGS